MGTHSENVFEVKLHKNGGDVLLMIYEEMEHMLRVGLCLRKWMEAGEVGPVGDGRTEYRFMLPKGSQLIGLIEWIQKNPKHYDYANN